MLNAAQYIQTSSVFNAEHFLLAVSTMKILNTNCIVCVMGPYHIACPCPCLTHSLCACSHLHSLLACPSPSSLLVSLVPPSRAQCSLRARPAPVPAFLLRSPYPRAPLHEEPPSPPSLPQHQRQFARLQCFRAAQQKATKAPSVHVARFPRIDSAQLTIPIGA